MSSTLLSVPPSHILMHTYWAPMFPEFFWEPLGCCPSCGNITPTALSSEPALIPLRSRHSGLDAVLSLWNIWQIFDIVAVNKLMLSLVCGSISVGPGPRLTGLNPGGGVRPCVLLSLSARHYPAENWLWRIISICWVRFVGNKRQGMDTKKDRVCLVADQQKREIKSPAWHLQYLSVSARLRFKYTLSNNESSVILSHTHTRPQASLGFPLRFDIQKMYCPSKSLIFRLLLTGWISMKLTVFGVLGVFFSPWGPTELGQSLVERPVWAGGLKRCSGGGGGG